MINCLDFKAGVKYECESVRGAVCTIGAWRFRIAWLLVFGTCFVIAAWIFVTGVFLEAAAI